MSMIFKRFFFEFRKFSRFSHSHYSYSIKRFIAIA